MLPKQIIVTWLGKYRHEKTNKPKQETVKFVGASLDQISQDIHRHVEAQEDNGWILHENEIKSIVR